MDENNVNTNTNDATGESGSKQSLGSKISSISKANQLRQQNGRLPDLAKEIGKNRGNRVDAAKGKAEENNAGKEDASKGKNNDNPPYSVKQKKAQMDAEKAIQEKVPKNKINDSKEKTNDIKSKLNTTAFKKAAKSVADTFKQRLKCVAHIVAHGLAWPDAKFWIQKKENLQWMRRQRHPIQALQLRQVLKN